MKEKIKNQWIFTYKEFTITYERITNDKYGNPRYNVNIYQNYVIDLSEITGDSLPIVHLIAKSYNIKEDIQKYIDTSVKEKVNKIKEIVKEL